MFSSVTLPCSISDKSSSAPSTIDENCSKVINEASQGNLDKNKSYTALSLSCPVLEP